MKIFKKHFSQKENLLPIFYGNFPLPPHFSFTDVTLFISIHLVWRRFVCSASLFFISNFIIYSLQPFIPSVIDWNLHFHGKCFLVVGWFFFLEVRVSKNIWYWFWVYFVVDCLFVIEGSGSAVLYVRLSTVILAMSLFVSSS